MTPKTCPPGTNSRTLEVLRKRGEITDDEYVAQRERILAQV